MYNIGSLFWRSEETLVAPGQACVWCVSGADGARHVAFSWKLRRQLLPRTSPASPCNSRLQVRLFQDNVTWTLVPDNTQIRSTLIEAGCLDPTFRNILTFRLIPCSVAASASPQAPPRFRSWDISRRLSQLPVPACPHLRCLTNNSAPTMTWN